MLVSTVLAALVASPLAAAGSLFGPEGLDPTAFHGQGYAEARLTWTDAAGQPWTLIERVRPTVGVDLTDRLSLEVTPELRAVLGRNPADEARQLLAAQLMDQLGLELSDALALLGCTLDTSRSYARVGDVLSLERAVLELTSPAFDLRLGRQGVSWGSALFLNPTDVFAQVLLAEPWQERQGVDSLRANVPVGERVLLSALIGTDDLPEELRQARDDTLPADWQAVAWKLGGRGTVALGQLDVSVVGFHHQSGASARSVAGLDLRGDHTVGWWLEGAWDGEIFASAGVDYSFPVLQRLYLAGQLTHDGHGAAADEIDPAARLTGSVDFQLDCEDGVPALFPFDPSALGDPTAHSGLTAGRWYGLGLLRWDLTADWQLTTLALVSLADGTGLVFPSTTVLLGPNLSVSGGVQALVGSEGEFAPAPEDLTVGQFDLSELAPRVTAMTWVRASY